MKKYWLAGALLGALTIAASASAQANPPTVVAKAPPPPVGVQKDGPFRLLLRAKVDAQHRRQQGYRADVVWENGVWWVIY